MGLEIRYGLLSMFNLKSFWSVISIIPWCQVAGSMRGTQGVNITEL